MWCLAIACLTLFSAYARAAEICCDDIEGQCFTDDYPYNLWPLPMCMTDINPNYIMYTRSNPTDGESFDAYTVPIVYDGARRTVFEAHGWRQGANEDYLHEMKNEFLEREDMNVVIIGWEDGAQVQFNYEQSSSNTRSMGAYTALVIDNLVDYPGGSDTRIWCLGFSLGAHLCGQAGMYTQIQRATGLDPSGPGFENIEDKTIGINQLSGRFVDIIHTDYTYGTERDLGHIDFYPNGGDNQPGCYDVADLFSCSHQIVTDYMIESIQADCYLSFQDCVDYMDMPASCKNCTCETGSCAIQGYGADYSCQLTGIHWVEVDADSPYCIS